MLLDLAATVRKVSGQPLELGMKGSMAEYELGLMRQRARQAFEAKIQRGHVMWEVPVGFVRTRDDRIEKHADRHVQHAIAGVFQKFREWAVPDRRCSGTMRRRCRCRRCARGP